MRKLPRQNIIEGQLEIVQETFEGVTPEQLEELRGGQATMKYGLFPPVNPVCPPKRKHHRRHCPVIPETPETPES